MKLVSFGNDGQTREIYACQMAEIELTAPRPEADEARVNLWAEIVHGVASVKVQGFYAGDNTFKIRFYPVNSGEYRITVHGMIEEEFNIRVEPARSGSHGKVRTKGTAFQYDDGALFHPFGTTVYALISQTDELIEQTMRTLENAPFNKIRMCVFPKHYDFNHNEPQYYPFEKDKSGQWDPTRPLFTFWDALDRHIQRLNSLGIQVDLILFHPYDRWGFDGMGAEKDLIYLDYLLRRLSAYPNIWWSLANEYELCRRTEQEWFDIEKFVATHDPYHHLLSCHNIFKIWDAGRQLTTHASIQFKGCYRLTEWIHKFNKPVMLDECSYEGNLQHFWGCITGKEMSRRFWRSVVSGAYCTHGETFYDDNDILWWAKGGTLKGESPARIAFCREIIESLPGHLEGSPGLIARLLPLAELPMQQQAEALKQVPEEMLPLLRAFLSAGSDAREYAATETSYEGHIGETVFLKFYDTRPIARDVLYLPNGRTYKIELLDTWNMTREIIAEGVSGTYIVQLPGREDMAVLCTAEQED